MEAECLMEEPVRLDIARFGGGCLIILVRVSPGVFSWARHKKAGRLLPSTRCTKPGHRCGVKGGRDGVDAPKSDVSFWDGAPSPLILPLSWKQTFCAVCKENEEEEEEEDEGSPDFQDVACLLSCVMAAAQRTAELEDRRGVGKTQSAAAKLQRLERRRERERHQAVLSDVPTAPVPETTPPDAPVPATTAPEAPCLPQSVENEIFNLRRERDEARKERDEAVQQLEKINFSANSMRENDIKCKLMTGLTRTLFDTLHQYLVQFVKPRETSNFDTR
ncbi:hypothetical protein ABVT39_024989 [Epinephelus coioides]